MKSTTRMLKSTLKLLEGGWTRGALARNRWGHCVSYNSLKACRFCLTGAMLRAEKRHNHITATAAENLVKSVLPFGTSIVGFNDMPKRTKAEVIQVVKRAIVFSKL